MVRRAGQGTGPEWMLAWSGEQGRVPGQSDVGMVRKPLTLRAGRDPASGYQTCLDARMVRRPLTPLLPLGHC